MRLKRGKVRSASRAVPKSFASAGEVLNYLHRWANTTRTTPYDWRSHRHGDDQEEKFSCTSDGLGIWPSRLKKLLDEIAATPTEEQAELLAKSLRTMCNNSLRSERQKKNAAAA